MKIRYTDKGLMRRFGSKIYDVADDMGANLMRSKKAVPVSSFDNPPVDKDLKAKKVLKNKFKSVGKRPLVGWVQDTNIYGGAELSNKVVIKAGEDLGYLFYVCTPESFDKNRLIECDFLVINNFFFFEPMQFHFILDLLFEYKKPYVKYEHDHREIIGSDARPVLARLLFNQSFLNIFISPMQEKNHRRHLGMIIDPYYLLPPAIDTKIFKLLDNIERDPKLAVNTCGRLYQSKGYYNMLQFALNKKDLKFEIYTRDYKDMVGPFEQLKNVKVFPLVENDYLPKVYNRAAYTIHLPQALEACGRTIAEGILCGCKPLLNDNMGIKSFIDLHVGDKKWFRYDKFKSLIDQGPYSFWKAVWYHINELGKPDEKRKDVGWQCGFDG